MDQSPAEVIGYARGAELPGFCVEGAGIGVVDSDDGMGCCKLGPD